MKKSIVFLVFFITIIPIVYSQNSHYFLDGFEITLSEGSAISVVEEDLSGAEIAVEIVDPDGQSIYGIFLYDDNEKEKLMNDEEYAFLLEELAYELYLNDAPEGFEEDRYSAEEVEFLGGNAAHWIELWFDDTPFTIMALDLRDSPGFGVCGLFCFPPFFELSYAEQYDILHQLLEDMEIEFFEAAG